MSGSSVQLISGHDHFSDSLQSSNQRLVVYHFAAKWAPQCPQITDVLNELAKTKDLSSVGFYEIDAEAFEEIAKKYQVSSVPTCLLVAKGKVCDLIEGANVTELTKKVRDTAFKQFPLSFGSLPNSESVGTTNLEDRLKSLINKGKVVVFMKGSPDAPRCGFSRQLMDILKGINCKFETFDILSDEEVRQGLKSYSNWPTYPQVYVDGNLVGGLDIIKELKEADELEATLKPN